MSRNHLGVDSWTAHKRIWRTEDYIKEKGIQGYIRWVNSGTIKMEEYIYYARKKFVKCPDGTRRDYYSFACFWDAMGDEVVQYIHKKYNVG